MPRKRHISPDYFTHVELFEAEQAEQLPLRLAYAGLWCVADRRGRFEWKPRALKLDVLPFDALDFDKILAALERHGFIRRYEVSGRVYGDIPTFLRHQHPHPKETDSRLPAYVAHPEHVTDARAGHQSSKSHASSEPVASKSLVPPGEPVGVSGPSEIQAFGGSGPSGDIAAARNALPEEYWGTFDSQLRRSHVPEAFADVILQLTEGRHPEVHGATPVDVGEGLRELALSAKPLNKLASYVRVVVKRRLEVGDAQGKQQHGSRRGPAVQPLRKATA
jgi:hypothetical protein